jgi:hypothetical protein
LYGARLISIVDEAAVSQLGYSSFSSIMRAMDPAKSHQATVQEDRLCNRNIRRNSQGRSQELSGDRVVPDHLSGEKALGPSLDFD